MHILTYTRQVFHNRDAVLPERFRRPNTRNHQKLRGVELLKLGLLACMYPEIHDTYSTSTQNDFLPRLQHIAAPRSRHINPDCRLIPIKQDIHCLC